MKRLLPLVCAFLIVVGFVAFLPQKAHASGGPLNILFGVATLSNTEAWAVGESKSRTDFASNTLIEHFSHNNWQVVSSPNLPGQQFSQFASIAAISSRDIWIVGSASPQSGPSQSLIEHWNGKQFQIVPCPQPQGTGSFLTSVSAVSSRDVWAVGLNNSPRNTTDTFIEHWNGTQWQIVSSPNGGPQSNYLTSVIGISHNDAWAAGNYVDGQNNSQSLIEHWNGHSWTLSQHAAPALSSLQSISAVSKNDIWAAGHFTDKQNAQEAFIEHWNGHSWSLASIPDPLHSYLFAIASLSSRDVWAVGYSFTSSPQASSSPLTEHWNGHTWSIVASPNPTGSNFSELAGVSIRSHGNVWAVGYGYSSGVSTTLTEHWNGYTWSVVSSPTP